ncbi:hypothetical protein ABT186_23230 [Streptomyces sp. NPDC001634]|uniref:hypothetical protein n=1 Tax=Streptomyces sp. NPDC001634 TaxID=3154390 RepID=UPI0033180DAB
MSDERPCHSHADHYAKAHTKHRSSQPPETHARLVAALFDGDWTAEDAAPAVLV